MTIESTGQISIGDDAGTNRSISGEFGGTAPHSLSEYYEGGTIVGTLRDQVASGTTAQANTSGNYTHTDSTYGTVRTIAVTPGTLFTSLSTTSTDANFSLANETGGVEEEGTAMDFTDFSNPQVDFFQTVGSKKYYVSSRVSGSTTSALHYRWRAESTTDGDYDYVQIYIGEYRAQTSDSYPAIAATSLNYYNVGTSSSSRVISVEGGTTEMSGTVPSANNWEAGVYRPNQGTNDEYVFIGLRIPVGYAGDTTDSSRLVGAVVFKDDNNQYWRVERYPSDDFDIDSGWAYYSMTHGKVQTPSITSQTATTGWSNNAATISNSNLVTFPAQTKDQSLPTSGNPISMSDFYGVEDIDYILQGTMTAGYTTITGQYFNAGYSGFNRNFTSGQLGSWNGGDFTFQGDTCRLDSIQNTDINIVGYGSISLVITRTDQTTGSFTNSGFTTVKIWKNQTNDSGSPDLTLNRTDADSFLSLNTGYQASWTWNGNGTSIYDMDDFFGTTSGTNHYIIIE